MEIFHILWSKFVVKTATFSKDYAVGFKRADCNIPKQSWNFVRRQPLYLNCIVEFVSEWGECNTFAVSLIF